MSFSPRVRRWSVVVVVCVVLYAVAGFFVAPPIIKSQLLKRLSAELARPVSVGKVRLNPFTFSATLFDLDVREKDGSTPFVGWRRLYVNFDPLASLRSDWVLRDVDLDGFHVAAALHADGTYNFSDLLEKIEAAAKKGAPKEKPGRPIRVVTLRVDQARIDFSDHSRATPFNTTVGPLTFALSDFRSAGPRDATYRFEAVTEAGESFVWSGTLSAQPLASHGGFEITNLSLKKYMPYFEKQVQADITNGLLTINGRYEASLTRDQRVLRIADTDVHLREFRLAERSNQQGMLELPALDVVGIQADALAMKAKIGRVALAGGRIAVRREQDGSLNLVNLLRVANAGRGEAAEVSEPSVAPDLSISEVNVKDLQVELTDRAAPRPAVLTLNQIQLGLKNLTLAEGAVIPVELSFGWAPEGTVRVAGEFKLKPEISADLKTDVAALRILPLSPYLEQFVNARITEGALTTSNTVHLSLAGGTPAITFDGDVGVSSFGLVDGVNNEDLAGFGALKLSGIRATTAPQLAVSMAEVGVTAPYARVIIGADKSINLLAAAHPAAAKPATADAAPAPASTPPRIEIGRVVVSDGHFDFVDRSVQPNVQVKLGQFGGTVAGLSSENVARAEVDLKGTVDGAGPVAITGTLDPLGEHKLVDLKVEVKNVDLVPMSPYTGKYAGYELARGKLVVDTQVRVEGQKLDSKNVVTLNQFTFGPATKSPDATGLPVRLGVALLKDKEGKIVIDLPVQGSFDDPSFRVGKVVMRVIGNLLTKAATSPFSLLGSMFGGGGDELAFQEFAPGSSELLPAEKPKLDTMVKALTNRPGLSLGLEGSYDAAADEFALKRQKLGENIRRRIWEAKHTADPNIPPPAQLVITPEEEAAMTVTLYREKYPAGTEFAAPAEAAPTVEAAPAPARPGLFRRLLNFLTFWKRENETRQVAKAEPPAASATQADSGASIDTSPEEMTARLAEAVPVETNDLRALAAARAQQVRDYFINQGQIVPDRLFLAQASDSAAASKGPRVFLTLQ